jgi:hypothetical protein
MQRGSAQKPPPYGLCGALITAHCQRPTGSTPAARALAVLCGGASCG